jgi:hypothetical protein
LVGCVEEPCKRAPPPPPRTMLDGAAGGQRYWRLVLLRPARQAGGQPKGAGGWRARWRLSWEALWCYTCNFHARPWTPRQRPRAWQRRPSLWFSCCGDFGHWSMRSCRVEVTGCAGGGRL